MIRFRWGVLALVVGLAVVLSGCEGFKIIRLSEYERLRGVERLNKDQAALITSLTHEKERLSDENASLKALLSQSEDLAEILRNEKERLEQQLKGRMATMPTIPDMTDVTVTQEPDGVGIVATSDVLFDTGSAQLKADGKKVLDQVVPIIKERSNKIRVCGYTDSVWTGVSKTFDSNFDLSGARALSVLNYLKEKSIDAARMHFAGYGEHDLVPPGAAPGQENKKLSRRVKIVLLHDWATHASGEAAPAVTPK